MKPIKQATYGAEGSNTDQFTVEVEFVDGTKWTLRNPTNQQLDRLQHELEKQQRNNKTKLFKKC